MSSIAAKVRQHKEREPEKFCADSRCLWQVVTPHGKKPCPKHPAPTRDVVVNSARLREKARQLHALGQEYSSIVQMWDAREKIGFNAFTSVGPGDQAIAGLLERMMDDLAREIAHAVTWEVVGREAYAAERAARSAS
jgi:hypothetical protein